jgi:GNAT superfamily N-acetyltransferase
VEKRLTMTNVADRPDLVPTVANWLWHAFWRHDGYTLEQTEVEIAASIARSGPPQTFVLLVDREPVGTASLAAQDLDERPDLTPWLANVYVIPAARGQRHATHLIAAVEDACRAASIGTLWLYTDNAMNVYTRSGWVAAEIVARPGKRPVTLMRRDLD